MYAFSDCTNLTTIIIPDSVWAINGTAFSNCTNLTSITIPKSITRIIAAAFVGCANLSSAVFVDADNWYDNNTKIDLSDSSVAANYLRKGTDLKKKE